MRNPVRKQMSENANYNGNKENVPDCINMAVEDDNMSMPVSPAQEGFSTSGTEGSSVSIRTQDIMQFAASPISFRHESQTLTAAYSAHSAFLGHMSYRDPNGVMRPGCLPTAVRPPMTESSSCSNSMTDSSEPKLKRTPPRMKREQHELKSKLKNHIKSDKYKAKYDGLKSKEHLKSDKYKSKSKDHLKSDRYKSRNDRLKSRGHVNVNSDKHKSKYNGSKSKEHVKSDKYKSKYTGSKSKEHVKSDKYKSKYSGSKSKEHVKSDKYKSRYNESKSKEHVKSDKHKSKNDRSKTKKHVKSDKYKPKDQLKSSGKHKSESKPKDQVAPEQYKPTSHDKHQVHHAESAVKVKDKKDKHNEGTEKKKAQAKEESEEEKKRKRAKERDRKERERERERKKFKKEKEKRSQEKETKDLSWKWGSDEMHNALLETQKEIDTAGEMLDNLTERALERIDQKHWRKMASKERRELRASRRALREEMRLKGQRNLSESETEEESGTDCWP